MKWGKTENRKTGDRKPPENRRKPGTDPALARQPRPIARFLPYEIEVCILSYLVLCYTVLRYTA